MKVIIITFCLIGAVSAIPISLGVGLVSSEFDSNSTESLSISQSSENDTSEVLSSEENISDQSSKSESLESTSDDKTSEESNSESHEDDGMDSMTETKDDSMGSEENVRKSWVRVFPSIVKVLSTEDNTEVKGQSEYVSNELTVKKPTHPTLSLLENPTDSSDTSDSADTSDITGGTPASNSSESTSSESNESNETSDSSDNSDASKSTEDSNASDSTELEQVAPKDCENGLHSCESKEYFFQTIGDDAHSPVDILMLPDEDERELNLRR